MKNLKLEIGNCRLVVLLLGSLLLSACGPQPKDNPPPAAEPVSDTAPSPAIQIAGLWETAGQKPWRLTLAPDGTVTEILRADGLHFVMAEGTLELRPAEDIYAKYVFGPCTWAYDEATRRLDVILAVDDMLIKTDQLEFRCSMIDEFSGEISGDGKMWTPQLINTAKFAPPEPDQIADYGTITFYKTN